MIERNDWKGVMHRNDDHVMSLSWLWAKENCIESSISSSNCLSSHIQRLHAHELIHFRTHTSLVSHLSHFRSLSLRDWHKTWWYPILYRTSKTKKSLYWLVDQPAWDGITVTWFISSSSNLSPSRITRFACREVLKVRQHFSYYMMCDMWYVTWLIY